MASLNSTDRPTLCLVVDRSVVRGDLCETVEAAVRCGVDVVQLRDRALAGRDWLAHAQSVASAARSGRRDVRITVNRRIDVALCIGATGVHLGFDAPDVAAARALVGSTVSIGVSAHAVEDVLAAKRDGADYVHLAPVYAPRSKPATRPALGLSTLGEAAAVGIPVIAQGGLGAAQCAAVLSAGASGIAVTGAILMAPDPSAAARALREALDAAR